MAPLIDRLIVAIVPDVDTDRVLAQLSAFGFGATRIASTGGYLRTCNSTVLIGLPASRLETCLAVLRTLCTPVTHTGAGHLSPELTELYASGYAPMQAGAGVAFVVKVDYFELVCQ